MRFDTTLDLDESCDTHQEDAPKGSPWGHIQTRHHIQNDCYWVSTASHGGIKLSRRINAKMPEGMRRPGGWYEEDCEWCLPVLEFRWLAEILADKVFKGDGGVDALLESADNTMQNWFPHEYAGKYLGGVVEVLRGKSYKYDKECFEAENAQNWVVIAAWGDWQEGVPKGMVGVLATIGGVRGVSEERYVLATGEAYRARGKFAYVLTGDEPAWVNPPRR